MSDKLTEAYEAWKLTQHDTPTQFQVFQGGYTVGAVSMRERAMASMLELTKDRDFTNDELINAIGALPDIAQE